MCLSLRVTTKYELRLLILRAVAAHDFGFLHLHRHPVCWHTDATYACHHHHLHLHADGVSLYTTVIAILLAFCLVELLLALTELALFLACCSTLVHHYHHIHHGIRRAGLGLFRLVDEAVQLLSLLGNVRHPSRSWIARYTPCVLASTRPIAARVDWVMPTLVVCS